MMRYKLSLEKIGFKSRENKSNAPGIYVKSGTNYMRQSELEGNYLNIIIVDIIGSRITMVSSIFTGLFHL